MVTITFMNMPMRMMTITRIYSPRAYMVYYLPVRTTIMFYNPQPPLRTIRNDTGTFTAIAPLM